MGTATFDPNAGVPLARAAAAILVVRYDPKKSSNFFTPVPNVVCLGIDREDGADPGKARFRYQFSILNPSAFPLHVEDVAGLDKQGPYVVKQDDRLCVLRLSPDGTAWTVLFDGFAQLGQSDLAPRTEVATFQALGVAIRCWDSPLGGALWRNGPDPTVVSDTPTDLPARFNPDGKPNRVPDGAFAGTGPDGLYPTFLDAKLVRTPDVRTLWSIDDAVAYILAQGNDQKYVTSPSLASLKNWLSLRVPPAEDAGIDDANPPDEPPGGPGAGEGDEEAADDPDDPEEEDDGDDDPKGEPATRIVCQDLIVTGDAWPVALQRLLRPHNFDFCFRLDQTASGLPFTHIDFYRVDDATDATTQTVRLQAPGADLDPSFTNVKSLSIVRDASQIANQYVVDTEPIRREVAVVLAPGFSPAAGDAADGTDKSFNLGDTGFTKANRDKYRVYVYGESGDGYWDFPSSTFLTTIPSLDGAIGAPEADPVTQKKVPRYATRRRPAIGTLFTRQGGKRLKAELHISKAYNTPIPGVYDGSATDWQKVVGGWELLDDRLGIRITEANITDWKIGSKGDTYPAPSGAMNLVKSQNNTATPTDKNNPRVYFRLTCVIEGDRGIEAVAKRRAGTITPFTITRRVDGRDRYVWHAVDKSSPYYVQNQFEDYEIDYKEANDYAEAMRNAHENCAFVCHITIPRVTAAYRIGAKVSAVNGRGINLRTNGGAGQGVAAQYPVITGISWSFDGEHSTTLTLSDLRYDPAPERTKGYGRKR